MTVAKAATRASGPAPLTVTYTYSLVNDGPDTLFHVGLSDDRCSPVTLQSGDVNRDQLLQARKTWTFTCFATYPSPGTYTNTTTARGTNTQTGLGVSSNPAQAKVSVS